MPLPGVECSCAHIAFLQGPTVSPPCPLFAPVLRVLRVLPVRPVRPVRHKSYGTRASTCVFNGHEQQ